MYRKNLSIPRVSSRQNPYGQESYTEKLGANVISKMQMEVDFPTKFPRGQALDHYFTESFVGSWQTGQDEKFRTGQGGLQFRLGGPGSKNSSRTSYIDKKTGAEVPLNPWRSKTQSAQKGTDWTGQGWAKLRELASSGPPFVDGQKVPYDFQNLAPYFPEMGYADGTGIWEAVRLQMDSGVLQRQENYAAHWYFKRFGEFLEHLTFNEPFGNTGVPTKDDLNLAFRGVLVSVFGTSAANVINQKNREGIQALNTKYRISKKAQAGLGAFSSASWIREGFPEDAPPTRAPAAPTPGVVIPAVSTAGALREDVEVFEEAAPAPVRPAAPAAPAAPVAAPAAAARPAITAAELLELMRTAKELGYTKEEVNEMLRALGLRV